MLCAAQECIQDLLYFCDFSEKHVASNCLASVVEIEGRIDVQSGREDAFWRGVKLQSTRTYCSLHHNRAVISLLYWTCHFSTMLFFTALNLSEIYGSVGRAAVLHNKGFLYAVTLTCYYANFLLWSFRLSTILTPSNVFLSINVSCTAGCF